MKYKFSPSKVSLLKDCPRCFWLEHNKGLKRPEGIFPSLPSGMDRILKVHFDEYAKRGELPPEINELKGYKLFDDFALLDVWRNNFKGIKYETPEFIIKGAVDAILVKDKKLVVLDYKTRGYPVKEDTHEHYIEQQSFYIYLLKKIGYDVEEYSYLLFYHPDKVMENVFLFHKDLIKIESSSAFAEKILSDAVSVLKGPIPDASHECNYCKYREAKVNLESREEIRKKVEKKMNLLDY